MGNCWVICLGSRDGCVGLLFEPFSNWLHFLLKYTFTLAFIISFNYALDRYRIKSFGRK